MTIKDALKELMKCVASNKQEKQRTYLENVESLSFTKKKKSNHNSLS